MHFKDYRANVKNGSENLKLNKGEPITPFMETVWVSRAEVSYRGRKKVSGFQEHSEYFKFSKTVVNCHLFKQRALVLSEFFYFLSKWTFFGKIFQI